MKRYTTEQVSRWLAKGKRMSIFTQPGMRIVFATFNAGYDYQKEEMRRLGFEIGKVYTVTDIDVGRSSSSVSLEGFKTHFNTVFFCNTPRQKLGTKLWRENYVIMRPRVRLS